MTTERAERTFAVVLNHHAGALLGRDDVLATMQAAFATHGLTAEFIPPEAGDLEARLALARESGADAVVVVGGDGSLSCAAQAMVGGNIPLGILPCGTMNLLARDLFIPTDDLQGAMRVLANFHTRAIDVGEVNGRVFLCRSMIGLPTRLAHYRESARTMSSWRMWGRFGAAVLHVLSEYRPLRLGLDIDGHKLAARTPAIMVSVNPFTDGRARQMGRACLDGGLLGVYIFDRLRLADIMRIGFSALLGNWRQDRAVDEHCATEVTITPRQPSVRVMNDGELLLLDAPLRYRVRHRALLMLAPPPQAA